MASGTNYSQEYGQAEKAYLESNFSQAAEIIDHLVEEFPQDPNVLLLRGHIYCYGFQNYDLARDQYKNVIEISDQQDLLDFAHSGIEQVEQLEQQSDKPGLAFNESNFAPTEMFNAEYPSEAEDSISIDFPDEELLEANFDSEDFGLNQESDVESAEQSSESNLDQDFVPDIDDDIYDNSLSDNAVDSIENSGDLVSPKDSGNIDSEPFAELPSDVSPGIQTDLNQVHTGSTFVVDNDDALPNYEEENFIVGDQNEYDDSSELEIDTVLTEPFSMDGSDDYGIEMDKVPDQDLSLIHI